MTSAHQVNGSSAELVASLALRRAHTGVAKLGEDYLDRGCPTPGYLAGGFGGLIDAGLLALADPDSYGLRRLSLTNAGHARYAQLRTTPRRAGLRVPDPQFPTKAPAGRRSSTLVPPSAPGGQPDSSSRVGRSSVGQVRWVRCSDEGRTHLLAPADVVVAATEGHADALCGRPVHAEGLTLTNGGALCMACVAGIPSHCNDLDPRDTP